MPIYSLKNQKFIIGSWAVVLDFLLGNGLQKLTKNSISQIILPCSLHDLALCSQNNELSVKYKLVDYCTSDSTFLKWFFSWRYRILVDRIYGPNLMLKALAKTIRVSPQKKHYFLSPNSKVETSLQKILKNQHQSLRADYLVLTKKEFSALQKIIKAKPDFVWLGVGSPKQVELAVYLKKHLRGAKIFCVGAAFEFITKQKKQAPHFFQLFGLEWFFRLIMEPRRLWRRYLVTIPKFLFINFWLVFFRRFFKHLKQV